VNVRITNTKKFQQLKRARGNLKKIFWFSYTFKNSDRRYLQIKRIAKEVVDRLLAE
jgi:hypothetical protein